MHRNYLKSSILRSAGYSADQMILELEFTSGEVYQYFKVPNAHYIDLMKAISHGEYFNRCIKDQFQFQKLA